MKAQMHNFSQWIDETNTEILKLKYRKLLDDTGFNILKEIHHEFKPFGYTGLFLLSESHFAIHTFPECNETYIELSSCVLEPFNNFIKKI